MAENHPAEGIGLETEQNNKRQTGESTQPYLILSYGILNILPLFTKTNERAKASGVGKWRLGLPLLMKCINLTFWARLLPFTEKLDAWQEGIEWVLSSLSSLLISPLDQWKTQRCRTLCFRILWTFLVPFPIFDMVEWFCYSKQHINLDLGKLYAWIPQQWVIFSQGPGTEGGKRRTHFGHPI